MALNQTFLQDKGIILYTDGFIKSYHAQDGIKLDDSILYKNGIKYQAKRSDKSEGIKYYLNEILRKYYLYNNNNNIFDIIHQCTQYHNK